MFHQLAEQLRGTIAAEWVNSIRFEKVDVGAYERLFVQAGFPMPKALRDALAVRGAFSIPPVDDEENGALEGRRGPAAELMSGGLRLLSPSELFDAFSGQRAGASADERLGSLWVFAAPRRYLWTEAYALDTSGDVRAFHEDDISEVLDLGRPAQSFADWERTLTEQVISLVKTLADAGTEPFGAKRDDVEPFELAKYTGKPWNAWVERIWRQALRLGSVDVARQVITDVGTLITKPSEADYRLPSALDLMHRLPAELRHAAVLEMWGSARPENPTVLATLEDASLMRSLVPIAWPHRGPADSDDVRWARAVLWLLGDPNPEQMMEAARRGARSRDVNETLWLRLEPFAKKHGVI